MLVEETNQSRAQRGEAKSIRPRWSTIN